MSAVLAFNPTHPRGHNQKPPADPVFFDKSDVRVGTVFRYYGANSDKGTDWVVDDITTVLRKKGEYTEESVNSVRIQGDVLYMTEPKTGRRHALSFVYMRYSAAWRVLAA